MNKFSLKKVSPWFDIGIGVLFVGFSIFIFVMVLINENSNKIFGYGFVAIFGFYGYLILTTAIYRKKYQKVSDAVEVKIDFNK